MAGTYISHWVSFQSNQRKFKGKKLHSLGKTINGFPKVRSEAKFRCLFKPASVLFGHMETDLSHRRLALGAVDPGCRVMIDWFPVELTWIMLKHSQQDRMEEHAMLFMGIIKRWYVTVEYQISRSGIYTLSRKICSCLCRVLFRCGRCVNFHKNHGILCPLYCPIADEVILTHRCKLE